MHGDFIDDPPLYQHDPFNWLAVPGYFRGSTLANFSSFSINTVIPSFSLSHIAPRSTRRPQIMVTFAGIVIFWGNPLLKA